MPRKQQFSSKQKKQQLQEKRKKKQHQPNKFGWSSDEDKGEKNDENVTGDEERKLNAQPAGTTHERVNKYTLIFGGDTKEEIARNVKKCKQPLSPINEKLLESSVEDVLINESDLGMPKRGSWNYSMSKEKLEKLEEKEFKAWTTKLDEYYHNLGSVSYYERNLETWRQLWRTLEMSNVVLFVCDVRYPTLHFSFYVYKYITEELSKQVILVLNKTDVVHPSVSIAWKRYFQQKYPEMKVVMFSAFPEQQKLIENTGKRLLKKPVIKKPGWAYGADSLIQLAKCHYENKKDSLEEEEEDGFVTIGMIGQPNAGKSSLINGLLQDKKVSVSKTPGHTKHFQTIFYSSEIRLCDCPGLVFPTTAPKQLQVISGMYPVAQVREPYSVVQYLAERIDLVSYLRIVHPNIEDEPGAPWSAWLVCFAWAEKNGYHTARTGRPDVYRGANSILRLVVSSRLCLRLTPPDYAPDSDLPGDYRALLEELVSFAKEQDEETKEQDEETSEAQYTESEDEGGESSSKNKFSLLGMDECEF